MVEADRLGALGSSALPSKPVTWEIDFSSTGTPYSPGNFLDGAGYIPNNFLSCNNGAKFPFSSYKQAIRYTPGAANVESIHRIEFMIVVAMRLGITCHVEDRELKFFDSPWESKGVTSSKSPAPRSTLDECSIE
jgi:hypothetical protein